ncbi:hypothetical protein [Streptomyces niger]|uniref:hypothetical protein n=1 Tax=Streptomyces niger TaxID=66373 RepID=UPI00069A6997|nr:hypothetical protein [Streptomyces niger]
MALTPETIRKITVSVILGYIEKAQGGPKEVKGTLRLGMGGREFSLKHKDETEQTYTAEGGSTFTYCLGDTPNVMQPGLNDPRKPQLYVWSLDQFPNYIRYTSSEDDSYLEVHRVEVRVDGDRYAYVYTAPALGGRLGKDEWVRLGKYHGAALQLAQR